MTKFPQHPTDNTDKKYDSLELSKLSETAAVDFDISDNARLILNILLRFVNHDTGDCYPSRKLLAAIADRSVRTVARALSELKEHHYIKIISGKGRKEHNDYKFLVGKVKERLSLKQVITVAWARWNKAEAEKKARPKKVRVKKRKARVAKDKTENNPENQGNDNGVMGDTIENVNGDMDCNKWCHGCQVNGDMRGTQNSPELTHLTNLEEKKKKSREEQESIVTTKNSSSQNQANTNPLEINLTKTNPPEPPVINLTKESADSSGVKDQSPSVPESPSRLSELFDEFCTIYGVDVSQVNYLPACQKVFNEKVAQGVNPLDIVAGARNGPHKSMYPLNWLKKEMWKVSVVVGKPPTVDDMIEQNCVTLIREELNRECQKSIEEVFGDFTTLGDPSYRERQAIEQRWHVVINLRMKSSLTEGEHQWISDEEQNLEEMSHKFPVFKNHLDQLYRSRSDTRDRVGGFELISKGIT